MSPNRIDHAVHAITSAQTHLKEYVLNRIVEAKTQHDALDMIAVIQDVEKIQRDISNILFKLDKFNNISEIFSR